ncbi:hypothetical protein [Halorarius halobius]|uniref:hypothetical protein n=1 Tax=Halorarius halobius TaxID=2962671 RepID=UPI0020CBE377|nr:hypothetical protein [Halorarius halobius]
MAFDNVTFFELHLDDARFGGPSEESAEPAEEETARGARVPLGLLVLAGVGAAVVARRLRRGVSAEVDLEAADVEAIAVE